MRRHETVRQILGVLIGGLVAETSTAVWAERQVSFVDRTDYGVGTQPVSVAVGDFQRGRRARPGRGEWPFQ